MPIVLQEFTTPTNTLVIADTAAAPGTLPTPAVFQPPALTSPAIDGNNNYIWSPNNASGVLVGNSARIVVDATVTAPITPGYDTNLGRYLGELTVSALVSV